MRFLQNLLEKGKSYSEINIACSALSTIIEIENTTFGRLPIIKRFMKEVFELKPTFPKYSFIWDVQKVFNYFRNLPNVNQLSLKDLSHKLVMLLCLTSGGQRAQTIHSICIEDIKQMECGIAIPIMSKIKQTKPGKHMNPFLFKSYQTEPKLCVVKHLQIHLARTAQLRNTSKLLISYIKPHKSISKDTVSRWIKDVMRASNIDIDTFSSHSCRAAASSKAKTMGTPVATILQKCGWSNERTVAKHYDK